MRQKFYARFKVIYILMNFKVDPFSKLHELIWVKFNLSICPLWDAFVLCQHIGSEVIQAFALRFSFSKIHINGKLKTICTNTSWKSKGLDFIVCFSMEDRKIERSNSTSMLFAWLVDIQLRLKLGTTLSLNAIFLRVSAIIWSTANSTAVYPINAVHMILFLTVYVQGVQK